MLRALQYAYDYGVLMINVCVLINEGLTSPRSSRARSFSRRSVRPPPRSAAGPGSRSVRWRRTHPAFGWPAGSGPPSPGSPSRLNRHCSSFTGENNDFQRLGCFISALIIFLSVSLSAGGLLSLSLSAVSLSLSLSLWDDERMSHYSLVASDARFKLQGFFSCLHKIFTCHIISETWHLNRRTEILQFFSTAFNCTHIPHISCKWSTAFTVFSRLLTHCNWFICHNFPNHSYSSQNKDTFLNTFHLLHTRYNSLSVFLPNSTQKQHHFALFKGIVHLEIKIWYLSAYPKGIQDVGVFFLQ